MEDLQESFDELNSGLFRGDTGPRSGGLPQTPWTDPAPPPADPPVSPRLRGSPRQNSPSTVESKDLEKEKTAEIKLFLKDLPEDVSEYRR